jgi:predicted lipoprotein with Yx(FWY)xxD motif
MTGRTIRWTLLVALAALLGVGAAMAATGALRAGGTVRTARIAKFGTVLVAANGRTLYRFTHDRKHVNTCSSNATCNKYWPPLLVKSGAAPTAGPGVNAKLLGTIPHGAALQVTYAGYPLYMFASDKGRGDAYGEGVQKDWFVVSPQGTLVKTPVAGAPAATTTTMPTTTAPAAGGGGYGSGYGG